MKIPLDDIRSDYEGYSSLIDLYHKIRHLEMTDLVVDFQHHWFDANLLAVLGAILTEAVKLNEVQLIQMKDETLFERNHFLSHFGGRRLPDFYDTTIPYKKFGTHEAKLFDDYLDRELLSKKVIPDMSIGLHKQIKRSLFELFENARIHGQCSIVFSCGQYYPKKKRLDFTVVDLGRTIRRNVREFLGDNTMKGNKTIEWAVTEGHTTKKGTIPGGLGLSLISGFVRLNQGKIQIISSDGFWEQNVKGISSMGFHQPFPGTLINLEINIADPLSYCLASEVSDREIF